MATLRTGELPAVPRIVPVEPKVQAALDAVETSKLESELTPLVAQVDITTLDTTLNAARDQAQAFDTLTKPINQAIDQVESLLARQTATLKERPPALLIDAADLTQPVALSRDFMAARLRYAALRYEAEARLNQSIANLYELQVRKSNISAERHHARSQRFFYGMLGAQLAVIIATFAVAARQRNFLWSIAAAAGLAAIALAIYVYLYV